MVVKKKYPFLVHTHVATVDAKSRLYAAGKNWQLEYGRVFCYNSSYHAASTGMQVYFIHAHLHTADSKFNLI